MSTVAWRIAGPSPQAPRYTLVGSVRVVDDLDARQIERWLNGVELYPYPPGPAHVQDGCAGGSSRVKDDGEVVPTPRFDPMTVYLADSCSAAGISGPGMTAEEIQARFVERATAAFTAIESAAIEREFMSGEKIGVNPHLGDGDGTFPHGNTAVSVLEALACLENEIAASGRRGMIHLSPGAMVKVSDGSVFVEDGEVLRTHLGTIVIPGMGYTGQVNGSATSKPVGHTNPASVTEEWAYATGPIELRRSEIVITPGTFAEALDRETNSVTYRVERYAVIDWDTEIHAAVRVDRSLAE